MKVRSPHFFMRHAPYVAVECVQLSGGHFCLLVHFLTYMHAALLTPIVITAVLVESVLELLMVRSHLALARYGSVALLCLIAY